MPGIPNMQDHGHQYIDIEAAHACRHLETNLNKLLTSASRYSEFESKWRLVYDISGVLNIDGTSILPTHILHLAGIKSA
jgi:hypothetical protein